MIDNFSLLVSHGLLALLCWRLLSRADLDKEAPPSSPTQVAGTGGTAAEAGRRSAGSDQAVTAARRTSARTRPGLRDA